MSTKRDLQRYDFSNNLNGFMRGLVVSDTDNRMEGRISVLIPKIMPFSDPNMANETHESKIINSDHIYNEEVKSLLNNKEIIESNALDARPVTTNGSGGGSLNTPRVGTWVYCFAEDGDPNKLYYTPFKPSNNGDKLDYTNAGNVAATLYNPEQRQNIKVIFEDNKGDFILYYDETTKTFEGRNSEYNFTLVSDDTKDPVRNLFHLGFEKYGYEIKFDPTNGFNELRSRRGHMIRMVDAEPQVENAYAMKSTTMTEDQKKTYGWQSNKSKKNTSQNKDQKDPYNHILVTTEKGSRLKIDDGMGLIDLTSHKGHTFRINEETDTITIKTSGGHFIEMVDGKSVIIKSSHGHTISMDGSSLTTKSSHGHSVAMTGGAMTVSSKEGSKTIYSSGIIHKAAGGATITMVGPNVRLN